MEARVFVEMCEFGVCEAGKISCGNMGLNESGAGWCRGPPQPPLTPGASPNCQSLEPAVGLVVFEAQAGGSCLGNSRVGWSYRVGGVPREVGQGRASTHWDSGHSQSWQPWRGTLPEQESGGRETLLPEALSSLNVGNSSFPLLSRSSQGSSQQR